jgi:hypothetical protein
LIQTGSYFFSQLVQTEHSITRTFSKHTIDPGWISIEMLEGHIRSENYQREAEAKIGQLRPRVTPDFILQIIKGSSESSHAPDERIPDAPSMI